MSCSETISLMYRVRHGNLTIFKIKKKKLDLKLNLYFLYRTVEKKNVIWVRYIATHTYFTSWGEQLSHVFHHLASWVTETWRYSKLSKKLEIKIKFLLFMWSY
jgi:hypothetical protein